MGVEVHLVVINQLPVTREHYAWLSFAEGTKYQQYRESLVQDIQQNEEFQVYLELLQELEFVLFAKTELRTKLILRREKKEWLTKLLHRCLRICPKINCKKF